MSDEEIAKWIKELEKRGFKVSKKGPSRRHTFLINADVLQLFFAVIEKRKMKVKDAVDQALSEWIEDNK
jgi:DNA-binding transcriptional regulator GbsR (MarR family)